jgi:hypothetical protein
MIDFLKNNILFGNKYKTHSEAVVIACFFNPQNSPYRTMAFNKFYESIKHLNHRIIECVIGDSKPELQESKNIKRVYTKNLLWHKESLLNNIISELPEQYKYVFWIDADVLFTNLNWLTDSVKQFQAGKKILQPFELCVHLDKDELEPSFDIKSLNSHSLPNSYNKKVWKSFSSNFVNSNLWQDKNYDNHGHVGFAWGATREVLEKVSLYDKALIGGADHIIAHAAAGQIPHPCIEKSFTENIEEINEWSTNFYKVVGGNIGCVEGNLYHIWHGDIEKRQYLKRVRDFTEKSKKITDKDENGLYVTQDNDNYMMQYFATREILGDNSIIQIETKTELGHGESGGACSLVFVSDAACSKSDLETTHVCGYVEF